MHEMSSGIRAISRHQIICRPCRNDVSSIGIDGFIPRWRKSNISTVCYVPGCNSTDTKITKIVDSETPQTFFCGDSPEQSEFHMGGTPLCTSHYGEWYRHLHPSQHLKCKTCNRSITENKSRCFPEPALIETFLKENEDYTSKIHPQDRLRYTCYKSYLIIIKHLKKW